MTASQVRGTADRGPPERHTPEGGPPERRTPDGGPPESPPPARTIRVAGVSTLALKLAGPLDTRLAALAQVIELAGEVNREPPPGAPGPGGPS